MSPAVRDAVATKARILEAAFGEFTKSGFAGARVDHIASKAKVNKALLYHYFADKEQLFRFVLEAKMAELSKITIDPANCAESVGKFFDFYAANRWMARLLMWEALDLGTKPVPDEDERCARYTERVETLMEAQRLGYIDGSLDIRQTFFTLVGLVHFWFAAPQTARMIIGGDPYTPQALKKRRAHVVAIARRILEAR